MKRLSLLALVLAGCADGPRNAVKLDWSRGDEFHVAASYRLGSMKAEESAVDLDGNETPQFGEAWSDDIVWTYQVVEKGLVPDRGDELYPYAETHDGVAKLSVIKAWADASLNDDPEILDADPVIYLVFREDRDRLAAIISFVNRDGERLEQAWSSRQLGRSWSPLSQSMLTALPTYLAPWSATYEDGEKTLENGSTMTTTASDGGVVDVFYDDEVGGGLVVSRYEKGAPWPTWTVTDSVDARLLSDDEVSAKRAQARVPVANTAPEDFDYRAALAAAVDIDAALTLDAETLAGGFADTAYDGYRPWAGSWWPLSQASLVFGYDGRDTLSDRIQSDIDPIKRDMDELSEAIRGMSEGSEKDARISEYRSKQTELVNKLVTFYDTLLQDLDGGRLTVASGKVTHVDGWSYDLDELSPLDKFALEQWAKGESSPNPFYASAWEILNHYNPSGGSWWGHCNGWAAAAILTNEPTTTVTSSIKGESVGYTTADVKGLLTEAHYSTYSRFYGARYDGPDDDISDLTPAAFHRLVSFYIRDQGVPLVFDTSANEEVWNFPAWGVDITVVETTAEGPDADKVNINTADAATLETLPGIGATLAGRIITYRETYGPFQTTEDLINVPGIGQSTYDEIKDQVTVDVNASARTFEVEARVKLSTDGVEETHVDNGEPESIEEVWSYTLTTDKDGLVLQGSWAQNDKHPDFAWVPYQNPTYSSGNSENPYLDYSALLSIIGSDFERK